MNADASHKSTESGGIGDGHSPEHPREFAAADRCRWTAQHEWPYDPDPGSSSPTNTPTSAHMNGGLAFEQETILDGVGIAYATGGSGMFNLSTDFPKSPDMIRRLAFLPGITPRNMETAPPPASSSKRSREPTNSTAWV